MKKIQNRGWARSGRGGSLFTRHYGILSFLSFSTLLFSLDILHNFKSIDLGRQFVQIKTKEREFNEVFSQKSAGFVELGGNCTCVQDSRIMLVMLDVNFSNISCKILDFECSHLGWKTCTHLAQGSNPDRVEIFFCSLLWMTGIR